MALILGIDTALEKAHLFVADGNRILASKTNSRQADHASWLHVAIDEALREAGKKMSEVNAVAVAAGPGSYTGLRVGMASAKGFCYALGVPLIAVSSFELIAAGAKRNMHGDEWICPMIDARRMEVFTTLYNDQLHQQLGPSAMVLDEHSFESFLDHQLIVFCGNGSVKWQSLCHHPNARFSTAQYGIEEFVRAAFAKFHASVFTELAWSEPEYVKNVYTPPRRSAS